MSFAPVTVLICARNASATIERAISSVIQETSCQIYLIDDHCTDDTVMRARRIAGKRLEVFKTQDPGGIALARQKGLSEIRSEYGAWLDADDFWITGRADRMKDELEKGADVVIDTIDLHDGTTGNIIRRLKVPEFIHQATTPVRLFERNYLPGDTQVAFRAALFREAGGYDAKLSGVESFDMLLRVISLGASFKYLHQVGYRMYAYPGSLSRNLSKQRARLCTALTKHKYEAVRTQCVEAGIQPRVAAWVLVSMAIYRMDYKSALEFLDEASPADSTADKVLEPGGPCPMPEGWRRAFQRGTILLLMGQRDEEAVDELSRAYRMGVTPEVTNNLGVVQHRLGKHRKAMELFVQANKLFSDYLDAKINLTEESPTQITSHPLRRQSSRSEY